MIKTDVLILGGGLAGLSTAYHLNLLSKRSCLIAEKQSTPGGTAGSVSHEGFTFDYTGHLLHLHDPYGKKLILDLLGDNLELHQRNSWIYSHDVYTRYPFQANTYGLPPRVVEECVTGFLKTIHRPDPKPLGDNPSFRDFALRTFGAGICKHFMFPYNEKLWRTPLERMTTQWQGRFVPKPSASEVLYGALTDQSKSFGYNAFFRYPKKGGIQVLPNALAARLKTGQLRTGAAVSSVDLRERVAVIEGLGEVSYQNLVNTMPLADFLDLALPLPKPVREARGKLRYNTVYCLNVGFKSRTAGDKHWVYFPERKFPFYRAGYTSNFAKSNAPAGASSLYIEISRHPDEKVDLPRMEKSIIAGLRSTGIIGSSDRILTTLWLPIRCAYVIYDFNRDRSVETIFKHFKSLGIESIGRYGAWKYSFMEETILDGKACAERLSSAVSRSEQPADLVSELKPLK